MTPRTPQCKVFWALLSNSKHSRVPEDSKSPTLEVLGFTSTFGQSGFVTVVEKRHHLYINNIFVISVFFIFEAHIFYDFYLDSIEIV
jgi:hypothetical protein